jgi:hypothetical protein
MAGLVQLATLETHHSQMWKQYGKFMMITTASKQQSK